MEYMILIHYQHSHNLFVLGIDGEPIKKNGENGRKELVQYLSKLIEENIVGGGMVVAVMDEMLKVK